MSYKFAADTRWVLWPERWMRPLALLANGAMLASTPIDGGHYFIDLIAGLAVAVLAITAALVGLPPLAGRAKYAEAAVPAE